MDLSTDRYSNDYLLEMLSLQNRKVKYEFIVVNRGEIPIGQISVTNAKISYDSTAEVMRTFSGEAELSELLSLESTDFRIIPYMCLDVGKDTVKWPIGKFIIDPSFSGQNFRKTVRITGYDLGKIALDDKTTSRFYVQAGGGYTSYIAQILGECYSSLDIPYSVITKGYDQEWDIGTPKIEIANILLQAINYTPVFFDESGVGISKKYIFPQLRTIDRKYITDKKSVILDGMSVKSDRFDIPNKFVRYTENVDSEYMIASYTNSNPSDPYSTIGRGRTIVNAESVEDVATLDNLQNYVTIAAINAMQSTDTLEFRTLNMPGHGYQDCLMISCPEYGINGRYIEKAWEMNLSVGGEMVHKCEKVVII